MSDTLEFAPSLLELYDRGLLLPFLCLQEAWYTLSAAFLVSLFRLMLPKIPG